jgi:hypothetical protein
MLRFTIARATALIFVAALALASLRLSSRVWAGSVLMLTLTILSCAILGVVYRRGAQRAFWLGFTLLGWGYMALASHFWWDRNTVRPHLPTTSILEWLYPYVRLDWLARLPSETDPRDWIIKAKLEEPIAMSMPNETPLDDILKYIKQATASKFYSGIQIYVDPTGLRRANKTMTSPVTIDVEGVPLRSTLALALKQLGLGYYVRDGMLIITEGNDPAAYAEHLVNAGPLPPGDSGQMSYLMAGHCYLGLVAACVGGAAGVSFFRTQNRLKRA